MREDDGRAEAVGLAGVSSSPSASTPPAGRRLVEQRFEPSGRSGDLTQRHHATACARRRVATKSRTMAANASGRVIGPRCPVRSSTTRLRAGESAAA